MRVVKINNLFNSIYDVIDGICSRVDDLGDVDIARESIQEILLLLDYTTYLSQSYTKTDTDLSKVIWHNRVAIDNTYSPFEAVGGYIKSVRPDIQGEIQVLDVEPHYCTKFILKFVEGKYSLNEITKSISIINLLNETLSMSPSDIERFDQFLNTTDSVSDKTHGYIIWDCINEYKNGNADYIDIIEAFDDNNWQNINLNKLISFNKELLKTAGIDKTRNYVTVGTLSSILSPNYLQNSSYAKQIGCEYLHNNRDDFYSKIQNDISLEVFCYPNVIKIPLFKAENAFSIYSSSKEFELVDNGTINIYTNKEKLEVKTGNNCWNEMKLYVDGNQKIVLSIGKERHLV